jgi:hypothetical protein
MSVVHGYSIQYLNGLTAHYMYHRGALRRERTIMTKPLEVIILHTVRLKRIGRSAIHFKTTKGNSKIRKSGRRNGFRFALAAYFFSGLGVPNATGVSDSVAFKFHASFHKYEIHKSYSETKLGLDLVFSLVASNGHNKMAEEEGFEPSVGY